MLKQRPHLGRYPREQCTWAVRREPCWSATARTWLSLRTLQEQTITADPPVKVHARLIAERGERALDPPALAFSDQTGQHLAELRVLGARKNVLPAIGLEERSLDRPHLG